MAKNSNQGYDANNLPSDFAGSAGFVPGASGPDTLDSWGARSKAGLKAGMNISNSAMALARHTHHAGSATGPIGASVAFALDTCITAYDANDDLGKTQSQIQLLRKLKDTHVGKPGVQQSTIDIVDWQINKFKRRTRYDTAESAGYQQAKKSIKTSWSGNRWDKAAAVGKGLGYTVAAAPGAVLGQVGTKGTRFARGFLKKTGLMGSQRKSYAGELYKNAKGGDPLARDVIYLVMSKGLTNIDAIQNLQDKIDDVVTKELAKAMSSYKGT